MIPYNEISSFLSTPPPPQTPPSPNKQSPQKEEDRRSSKGFTHDISSMPVLVLCCFSCQLLFSLVSALIILSLSYFILGFWLFCGVNMKLMLVDHLDSGEILLNTREWWVGGPECCYEFSRCWIAEVFESGQEGAVLLSRSIKYSFLVKYRWVVGPTVQKLCRCCILKWLMCNRRWSFYLQELRIHWECSNLHFFWQL